MHKCNLWQIVVEQEEQNASGHVVFLKIILVVRVILLHHTTPPLADFLYQHDSVFYYSHTQTMELLLYTSLCRFPL